MAPREHLDIVVCLRYFPSKTAWLHARSKKMLAADLRKELDLLKLPHPPEINIAEPDAQGLVVFFWTTYRNSPLYHIVSSVAASQDMDPIKTVKEALSIQQIQVSEAPPSLLLDVGPFPPRSTKRSINEMEDDNAEYGPERLKKRDSDTRHLLATSFIRICSPFIHRVQHSSPDKPKTLFDFFPDAESLAATSSTTTGQEESATTREFWNTRRKLNAAFARAQDIERQLEEMGVFTPHDDHSVEDLPMLLAKAQDELMREQKSRRDIERVLQDVLRECEEPRVVPQLIKMMYATAEAREGRVVQ
ncbi:hypothetical protein CPB85DRAFT_1560091 [Mucidula mucida]|nr:hypothetical protein CPB85DRAFT_1560091 [Mucidula mucida]